MPKASSFYLYSDSYKSEILMFSAFATFSMTSIVGDVCPFSILFSVALLTPLFFSSCSSTHPLLVRACHNSFHFLTYPPIILCFMIQLGNNKLEFIESPFVQPLLSILAELKDMSILLEVHRV